MHNPHVRRQHTTKSRWHDVITSLASMAAQLSAAARASTISQGQGRGGADITVAHHVEGKRSGDALHHGEMLWKVTGRWRKASVRWSEVEEGIGKVE